MPKGSKILMADDDKMLIDMYKERLELAGYNVTVARNGEEGLAKVREVKPDIVMLDVMMPKVNGYEALASLKSDPLTKDTPVIMLSALMRDFNREKAVEAGADDYLIKSEAMPADVITKIEQVLEKYKKNVPTPGVVPSSIPSVTAAMPPVAEAPAAPIPTPVTPPPPPPPPPPVAPNPPEPAVSPSYTPPAAVIAPAMVAASLPTPAKEDNIVFKPEIDTPQPVQGLDTNPVGLSETKTSESTFSVPEAPVIPPPANPDPMPKPNEDIPVLSKPSEASKEKPKPKENSAASTLMVVVLTILLTTLINFALYYFVFFKQ